MDQICQEEKITLELTRAEIIMLQELTEDIDCGYQWMCNIAEDLRTKALQAYQKPKLSQQEYQSQLENKTKMWRGEPAEVFMVHAEKSELKFFYDVEEDHV